MKRLREYNTLSGTPFVATLYGYGQGNGYGCPAGLALGGYSPNYLAVYATGANSNRVYWAPVPNAVSYKVYRTQTAGQYDFTQAPLATVSGSAHFYDDPFLQTDTLYYYTVIAIFADGTYKISEEDGEFPTSSATLIPWNGSAYQILATAWQIAQAYPGAPLADGSVIPVSWQNLRVLAPDGTVYHFDSQGNPVGPENPTCTYDASAGDFVWPGGFTAAAPPLEQTTQSSSSAALAAAGGGTSQSDAGSHGAVRRVASYKLDPTTHTPYVSVNCNVYLPPFSVDGHFAPNTSFSTSAGHNTPSVYIGVLGETSTKVRSVNIDAGLMFSPANWPNASTTPPPSGTAWTNRWGAYLRIADGPKAQGYVPLKLDADSAVPDAGTSFLDADDAYGNEVHMNLSIVSNSNACVFTISGGSAGITYQRIKVSPVRLHGGDLKNPIRFNQYKATNYRMKRVVSLDQDNFYGKSYPSLLKPPYDLVAGMPFKDAVADGTDFKVQCHSQLATSPSQDSWMDWTESLTDHRNGIGKDVPLRDKTNIYFYDSRWISGTPGSPIKMTFPVIGSPLDEWVEIIMNH